MPPHPLTNFEIQKYYQNESKFNSVFSRNNLPKIKNGVYIINLDEYESIRTHWMRTNWNFFGNKSIITNIYSIQAYDSIMCRYFSIGFIDFMLKGKSILEYTNLFSPSEYKKNDKTILKYF